MALSRDPNRPPPNVARHSAVESARPPADSRANPPALQSPQAQPAPAAPQPYTTANRPSLFGPLEARRDWALAKVRELETIAADHNRSQRDRESARRGARLITRDIANYQGMSLTQTDLDADANPLLTRMDAWQQQQAQAQAQPQARNTTSATPAGSVPSSQAATATPPASQAAAAAIAPPSQSVDAAPPLDPQAAVANVRAAVEAEFGHLPDGVEIIHDPSAVDPKTGKPWAARIQNGRITLNAAHLTAQDAVANIEHEAIHDRYRKAMRSDPKLRRQWEALNKVIDQHPDLAQEVDAAGYTAEVRTEEIAVNLAQRLSGTPAASAWSAFVESVRIALNQGLAAGKKNWDHHAAQRMAIRLLGQARGNVQGNHFGKQTDGEARYSYAVPQGGQGDATAEVDPSMRPNPLDPTKLAKYQDDLAQRLSAPKDPQIEQLLMEADAA